MKGAYPGPEPCVLLLEAMVMVLIMSNPGTCPPLLLAYEETREKSFLLLDSLFYHGGLFCIMMKWWYTVVAAALGLFTSHFHTKVEYAVRDDSYGFWNRVRTHVHTTILKIPFSALHIHYSHYVPRMCPH